ncbi:MAG: acyl carrier protein [Burkholderiaceae bacterium]
MNEFKDGEALKALEAIFRDLFLDDRIELSETTSPADIAEWDSLAHVSLLAAVERSFGVRFTAEDMSQINNVSTLLAILKARKV